MATMDILKLGALQKLIIMETILENREIGATVNENVKMVSMQFLLFNNVVIIVEFHSDRKHSIDLIS